MAKIRVVINHKLQQNDALERIKNLLKVLKETFADKISELNENWKENIGEFQMVIMGMPISGELNVCEEYVEIKSEKLPFLASLFLEDIETKIKQGAEELLT